MTPNYKPVVDELKYRSYCYQRMTFPDVEPESWALIFGPAVVEMERKFLMQFVACLMIAAAEEELPN